MSEIKGTQGVVLASLSDNQKFWNISDPREFRGSDLQQLTANLPYPCYISYGECSERVETRREVEIFLRVYTKLFQNVHDDAYRQGLKEVREEREVLLTRIEKLYAAFNIVQEACPDPREDGAEDNFDYGS